MSRLSPQGEPSGHLIRRRSSSEYQCTAYILDMSCQDSKRARQRQRQAETSQRERMPLSPGALRARRSRARRRVGLCVFRVQADQRRTFAALRAAGRLADDATREEIEHALAEVLSDFARRWLGREKRVRVTRPTSSARL
jgi:hypothetical protein